MAILPPPPTAPPPLHSSSSSLPFTHQEQVTHHFQHLESDEAITLSPVVTSTGPCVARPLLVLAVVLSLIGGLQGRRARWPSSLRPRCHKAPRLYWRRRAKLIDLSRNQKRPRLRRPPLSVRSGWHCVSNPLPAHLGQEDGGGVCRSRRGRASACSSRSGFIK